MLPVKEFDPIRKANLLLSDQVRKERKENLFPLFHLSRERRVEKCIEIVRERKGLG